MSAISAFIVSNSWPQSRYCPEFASAFGGTADIAGFVAHATL
jgi:hypothetical protein